MPRIVMSATRMNNLILLIALIALAVTVRDAGAVLVTSLPSDGMSSSVSTAPAAGPRGLDSRESVPWGSRRVGWLRSQDEFPAASADMSSVATTTVSSCFSMSAVLPIRGVVLASPEAVWLSWIDVVQFPNPPPCELLKPPRARWVVHRLVLGYLQVFSEN